jgi:uncharacterized protein YukE
VNAVPKRAAPRSVVSLEGEVGDLEHSLVELRREQSTAKTSLPRLIAEADAEAISACRKTISQTESAIARTAADLEELREAVKVAHAREQATARAHTYKQINQAVAVNRQELNELADAIAKVGEALNAAVIGLQSTEATMRKAGVQPDAYVLRAKLMWMVNASLYLATEGQVGEARGLDSDHQLRQSGRANLKTAALEYATLTMQRVRSALHLTSAPE